MALPFRPRSFAERPKSAVLLSQPANDNARDPRGSGKNGGNPLGGVENGVFRFASPEAEEQWIRNAYQSGVNAETWQLGDEIDEQTAELAKAGLGGPMPAIYLGPDGKHRTINAKTIETAAVRDHRNRRLSGMTMDQIAAAGKMPGEDEWVEQWKAERANDNQPAPGSKSQSAATPATPPKNTTPTQRYGKAGVTLPQSSNEAVSQDAEDLARIGWNSVLGDYGDEGRATLGAIGAWWDGESFTGAYEERLAREKAESKAATERQGLKGTAAEMATGFIPVVGDVSGFVSDFKDWKENGDEWGWGDYGLALAGALPFVPNRKIVKGAKKISESLLGKNSRTVGELGHGARPDGLLQAGKRPADVSSEIQRLLPNQETQFLTKGEALNLPGDNRGLVYVLEAEPHLPHAAWYQGETPGTIWSVEHQKPANPALRYDNPDGDNLIKFDGLESGDDGIHLVLIDSKTAMAPKPGIDNVKRTLERIGLALAQNNASSGVKFKVYYDFPTEREAERARKIVTELGHKDTIAIRVRAATALGQELFRELRER